MKKSCENRYKLCRETAGFTQEHAAEVLNVSVRALSDYENGHVKVPDEMVAAMTSLYKCPFLRWWHVKSGALGDVLSEKIEEPKTPGDMALQLWTAREVLVPAVDKALKVLSGKALGDDLSDDDIATLNKVMTGELDQARSMIVSATLFTARISSGTNN